MLLALEYDEATIKANGTSTLLSHAGISPSERVHLKHRDLDHRSIPSTVTRTIHSGKTFPAAGANFLDRMTVRKVAMACTLPPAKEFREWLADVSIKVEDTGGYLLNEAARDTAFADTRTTVPLPSEIAGGYAALIEARKAEMKAREGELAALMAAATEQAEREKIQAKLIETEAKAAAETARASRLQPMASGAEGRGDAASGGLRRGGNARFTPPPPFS